MSHRDTQLYKKTFNSFDTSHLANILSSEIKSDCNYSLIQKGNDIEGNQFDSQAGISLSISSNGNVLIIGSWKENNGKGNVSVYEYHNSTWVKTFEINGENETDEIGFSLSISDDGNIFAFGNRKNGKSYVYRKSRDVWTLLGDILEQENPNDYYGWSVSLSKNGNILAVGSLYNDLGRAESSGYVKIYKYFDAAWMQIGTNIIGENIGDQSGYSISLSDNGNVIAIGSRYNDTTNITNSGSVRVYKFLGSNWVQIGRDIDGTNQKEFFGSSVSLSGNGKILAIGAPGESNNTGLCKIYKYQDGDWYQLGENIRGINRGEYCGNFVNLSTDGTVLSVCSPFNNGVGLIRIYKYDGHNWIKFLNDINSYHGYLSGDGTNISVGDPYLSNGIVKVYKIKQDMILSTLIPDYPIFGSVYFDGENINVFTGTLWKTFAPK